MRHRHRLPQAYHYSYHHLHESLGCVYVLILCLAAVPVLGVWLVHFYLRIELVSLPDVLCCYMAPDVYWYAEDLSDRQHVCHADCSLLCCVCGIRVDQVVVGVGSV